MLSRYRDWIQASKQSLQYPMHWWCPLHRLASYHYYRAEKSKVKDWVDTPASDNLSVFRLSYPPRSMIPWSDTQVEWSILLYCNVCDCIHWPEVNVKQVLRVWVHPPPSRYLTSTRYQTWLGMPFSFRQVRQRTPIATCIPQYLNWCVRTITSRDNNSWNKTMLNIQSLRDQDSNLSWHHEEYSFLSEVCRGLQPNILLN